MNLYKLPNQEELTEERKEELQRFFNELIDLCNKYRVTFAIGSTFLLQKEVIDGKLFNVTGFSYDEESKLSFPVFVDVMSGDKDDKEEII